MVGEGHGRRRDMMAKVKRTLIASFPTFFELQCTSSDAAFDLTKVSHIQLQSYKNTAGIY